MSFFSKVRGGPIEPKEAQRRPIEAEAGKDERIETAIARELKRTYVPVQGQLAPSISSEIELKEMARLTPSLLDLPAEILEKIMADEDKNVPVVLQRTCKKLYELTSDDKKWKRWYRPFGDVLPRHFKSYQEAYSRLENNISKGRFTTRVAEYYFYGYFAVREGKLIMGPNEGWHRPKQLLVSDLVRRKPIALVNLHPHFERTETLYLETKNGNLIVLSFRPGKEALIQIFDKTYTKTLYKEIPLTDQDLCGFNVYDEEILLGFNDGMISRVTFHFNEPVETSKISTEEFVLERPHFEESRILAMAFVNEYIFVCPAELSANSIRIFNRKTGKFEKEIQFEEGITGEVKSFAASEKYCIIMITETRIEHDTEGQRLSTNTSNSIRIFDQETQQWMVIPITGLVDAISIVDRKLFIEKSTAIEVYDLEKKSHQGAPKLLYHIKKDRAAPMFDDVRLPRSSFHRGKYYAPSSSKIIEYDFT